MTKPLSIGLVTPAVTGFNCIDSGIGQHFADLAIGLTEAGHTVVAVTPAPTENIPAVPALAAVRFAPFNARMPRWLDRLSGLRWQLHSLAGLRHRIHAAQGRLVTAVLQDKIDLIETISSGVLAGSYLRQRPRRPVVTRIATTAAQLVSYNAGGPRWPERVEQRWEERLVRSSDRLITHTQQHCDELCRSWQISPATFTIIPLGIRLPLRSALPTAAHRETVEVLYVGRFEHRKGIDVLLEVIPGLLAADPRVRFTLVGQDSGGQWQQRFWATHPTLDRTRVVFAGVVSSNRLQLCYRACDVFVAPSRYESFGLIFVEAMAWGKPTVGCRAGGMPEVIDDGRTGSLAEPGDTASLAAALLRLVQSPELRAEFGSAGRLRAEAHFSHTTLAARSAEFYRSVLSGPSVGT